MFLSLLQRFKAREEKEVKLIVRCKVNRQENEDEETQVSLAMEEMAAATMVLDTTATTANNGEEVDSLCEVSTQTEWSGSWENNFIPVEFPGVMPFLWPSRLPSFCIPPPPDTSSSAEHRATSPCSTAVVPGALPPAVTSNFNNINPREMASSLLLAAGSNGVNQFQGNYSFQECDRRAEQYPGEADTGSEEDEDDEDECDAFEYEVRTK